MVLCPKTEISAVILALYKDIGEREREIDRQMEREKERKKKREKRKVV